MRLRSWLILVALLAFGGVAVAVWLKKQESDERLEENRRIIEQLQAQLRARGGPRPLPWDADGTGDAWPLYEAVLEQVAGLDGETFGDDMTSEDVLAFLDPDTEPDFNASEYDAWFERTRPILTALRTATRAPNLCAGNGLPQADMAATTEMSRRWRHLGEIGALHAYRLLARREFLAVIDVSLSRAQSGLDVLRYGGLATALLGMGISNEALTQLRAALSAGDVEAERLTRLSRELDVLAANLIPLDDPWLVAELYFRLLIQTGDAVGDNLGTHITRSMYAEALATLRPTRDALLQVVREQPGVPAKEEAERIVEGVSGNALARMFFVIHPWSVSRHAVARLQFDLSRVAVAILRFRHRHGEAPTALRDLVPDFLPAVPPCPVTGDPLRYEDDEVASPWPHADEYDLIWPMPASEDR